MVSNSRTLQLIVVYSFLQFFSGCLMHSEWTGTRSLDEYADQIFSTKKILRKYIGQNKQVVKNDFGEANYSEIGNGSKYIGFEEKVFFDEFWEYSFMSGVPILNARASRILFYFQNGVVVAVDAN